MKKVEYNELILRILSTASQSILLYMILSLVNYWFFIKGISLILSSVSALASFVVTIMLESTNLSISTKKITLILLGVLISISISVGANLDKGVAVLLICIVEYFGIWISTIKRVNFELSAMYDKTLFYRDIGIIFVINMIYYAISNFKAHSPDINQASIIFIVLSLFLLMGLRSATTIKNSENKTIFRQEAFKAAIVLLIILIFSSTWLQASIIMLIKLALGFVFQGVYFLSKPVLYILAFIAEKLKSIVAGKGSLDSGGSDVSGDKAEDFLEFDTHSINQIASVASIIIAIVAFALVIYFSYKHFMKSKSKQNECDYSESREFIIRVKDLNGNNRFNKLKSKLNNIIDDIKLGVGTDYDLKIRNEYRKFLIALQNQRLIDENITAYGIFEQLEVKLSNNKEGLQSLTNVYEKIRYGSKASNKEEYEGFQDAIKSVIRELKAFKGISI